MKRLFTILVAAALALSLAACADPGVGDTEGQKNVSASDAKGATESAGSVVGTWANNDSDEVLVFNADGTGSQQLVKGVNREFTYEATDTELTITYDAASTIVREYSLEGDTLKIKKALGGYDSYTNQ